MSVPCYEPRTHSQHTEQPSHNIDQVHDETIVATVPLPQAENRRSRNESAFGGRTSVLVLRSHQHPSKTLSWFDTKSTRLFAACLCVDSLSICYCWCPLCLLHLSGSIRSMSSRVAKGRSLPCRSLHEFLYSSTRVGSVVPRHHSLLADIMVQSMRISTVAFSTLGGSSSSSQETLGVQNSEKRHSELARSLLQSPG